MDVSTKTLIKTENLSFENFLHYPDICIAPHTVTFVSGRSGCGKSTLFKLLNGSVSPSQGSIFYQDMPIAAMDKISLRRKILLAKQIPYLFRGTILDNYKTFHAYHESPCPDNEAILSFLKLCCIPADINASCDTMSGGEQQRVFLSIALSLSPEVLLLDEPTASLNQELAHQLLVNIIAFTKQHKINLLVISHDMTLQAAYAENVIDLERSHHE